MFWGARHKVTWCCAYRKLTKLFGWKEWQRILKIEIEVGNLARPYGQWKMWMLSGPFPAEFLDIQHTSRTSNLGFKIPLVGEKYYIYYRFRTQSIYGFATEVLKHFRKGQRPKGTGSHQTGGAQLKQDRIPLEDPWGLQPFSLDNSERRPASSNLGRGLFILLGSNQGYGSLMVFMSLKVFHIWARSMLYGSQRRPCSQTEGLGQYAKSTQMPGLQEKVSSINPLARAWRFSQWCSVGSKNASILNQL